MNFPSSLVTKTLISFRFPCLPCCQVSHGVDTPSLCGPDPPCQWLVQESACDPTVANEGTRAYWEDAGKIILFPRRRDGLSFTSRHAHIWAWCLERLQLSCDSLRMKLAFNIRWRSDKESSCQGRRCKRCRFDPWVGKIPWRRKWQSTSIFLLRKFHGQRSLVVYIHGAARSWTVTECLSTCTSRGRRSIWVSEDVTELMSWPPVKWPHGLSSP